VGDTTHGAQVWRASRDGFRFFRELPANARTAGGEQERLGFQPPLVPAPPQTIRAVGVTVGQQVRVCRHCHADTPAFHDVTKTEFQNCTACHSRIHGSNLNRNPME